VNDSYGQPEGTAQAEAAASPVATYAEEEEKPTEAAWLIIATFPYVMDGGR